MTKKPRITITLEPHQRDVVGRIAKANGVPTARVVSDIMEAVTPYLERVVIVVEQAAKLKGKTIAAPLVRALGRAEGRAMQLHEDVLGQVDLFVEALREQEAGSAAETDAQRPPPATSPTPVPVITGVRSSGQGARRAPKAAPKGRAGGAGKARKAPRSATVSGRKKGRR